MDNFNSESTLSVNFVSNQRMKIGDLLFKYLPICLFSSLSELCKYFKCTKFTIYFKKSYEKFNKIPRKVFKWFLVTYFIVLF